MEITDNKDPTDKYWLEEDEDDDIQFGNCGAKRLVDGIDIKDLCDGKEVIIKLAKDNHRDILNSDDGAFEEVLHCDPKTLREKRGAPPLDCKFNEFASKMINVTDDGLVKKQIISTGVGKVVPDNAYVTINYNMYKENCEMPFDSTYLRNRPEKFRLGQGETILGLDYAVKSMKKNENSCFFIKWELAYGALGCPDRIEPKCDVIADVTLVDFVEIEDESDRSSLSKEEINKIDFKKLMNQAKQMICQGRDEFSKGNLKGSAVTYKKALRHLNNIRLADEEQEKVFLEKKLKVLVNLAVCYNKLGKPELACVACQEALSIDRNSVKANFHYGKANLALSNFKAAYEYLIRADKLKPSDADINRELKKLNDKQAVQLMADKIFWKKVFNSEEKEEKRENEMEKETPRGLESFEESLRKSLEECSKEKTPYIIPGPLLVEEKRICSKLANSLNLNFGAKDDFFVFSSEDEVTGKT